MPHLQAPRQEDPPHEDLPLGHPAHHQRDPLLGDPLPEDLRQGDPLLARLAGEGHHHEDPRHEDPRPGGPPLAQLEHGDPPHEALRHEAPLRDPHPDHRGWFPGGLRGDPRQEVRHQLEPRREDLRGCRQGCPQEECRLGLHGDHPPEDPLREGLLQEWDLREWEVQGVRREWYPPEGVQWLSLELGMRGGGDHHQEGRRLDHREGCRRGDRRHAAPLREGLPQVCVCMMIKWFVDNTIEPLMMR